MRKKMGLLLLCLALLPWAGSAAEEASPPEGLYRGWMRIAAKMFASYDRTEGVDRIGYVPVKAQVVVLAVTPSFDLVYYPRENLTGYVKRLCVDELTVSTIDPAVTPPYGVEFNQYLGVIGAQDAPVTDAIGGETLITLHRGARVSFIGYESGYAKLVYHRQYGYIDSRLLTDVVPVSFETETAAPGAPVASFTSFYKITTDASNLGRMTNIAVACARLSEFAFPAGAELNFNRDIGPYSAANGYQPATVLVDGKAVQGYGGGTCQVSSTLYNVVLQLPGLTVLQRRAHGANGASYLPIGVDAAVGNDALNFRFRNDYPFPIQIVASSQDGALTIAIHRAGM